MASLKIKKEQFSEHRVVRLMDYAVIHCVRRPKASLSVPAEHAILLRNKPPACFF